MNSKGKGIIYINGHEAGICDFDLSEIKPVNTKIINNKPIGNLEATMIVKINYWNRLKLRFWAWKESLKTQQYEITLKGE